MRTRAKFYIRELTLLPGGMGVKVNLSAVSRGDRNANWAQATPSGNIEMYINNPLAAGAWEDLMRTARETGRQPEVFVDFTTATDGWPGDGHAYRESEYPPGIYGHGKCGECGAGRDDVVAGKPAH